MVVHGSFINGSEGTCSSGFTFYCANPLHDNFGAEARDLLLGLTVQAPRITKSGKLHEYAVNAYYGHIIGVAVGMVM